MRRDGLAGVDDEGNVRLAIFVQRRRHADDDRLDFLDAAEIGGGNEPAGLHRLGNGLGGNMFDVTPPLVERVHFGRVNIQAQDRHPPERAN